LSRGCITGSQESGNGGGGSFAGAPLELCRVEGRLAGVQAVPARRHLPPTDALLVKPTRFTVQLLREEDCAVVMSRSGEIRIEYYRWLQKKQKASNDVRLRELRLVPGKECLQFFSTAC